MKNQFSNWQDPTIKELREMETTAQTHIEGFREKLKDALLEKESLRTQLGRLVEKVSDLEEGRDLLEGELTRKKAAAEQALSSYVVDDISEAELDERRNAVSAHEMKLADRREMISTLRAKISSAEEQLKKVEDHARSARGKIYGEIAKIEMAAAREAAETAIKKAFVARLLDGQPYFSFRPKKIVEETFDLLSVSDAEQSALSTQIAEEYGI